MTPYSSKNIIKYRSNGKEFTHSWYSIRKYQLVDIVLEHRSLYQLFSCYNATCILVNEFAHAVLQRIVEHAVISMMSIYADTGSWQGFDGRESAAMISVVSWHLKETTSNLWGVRTWAVNALNCISGNQWQQLGLSDGHKKYQVAHKYDRGCV